MISCCPVSGSFVPTITDAAPKAPQVPGSDGKPVPVHGHAAFAPGVLVSSGCCSSSASKPRMRFSAFFLPENVWFISENWTVSINLTPYPDTTPAWPCAARLLRFSTVSARLRFACARCRTGSSCSWKGNFFRVKIICHIRPDTFQHSILQCVHIGTGLVAAHFRCALVHPAANIASLCSIRFG